MTGRLSEESVIKSLDSGWQSLVWKAPFSNKYMDLGPAVDFRAILAAKDSEAAAQAVPRRDMYLALVTQGPEEALEILPLLSAEQFITIMDNESWHEGQLVIHQAIRWLDLYKNMNQEHLYKRFRQLDEEYQVALLNPYVELVDEEVYEKLPHDEQDKFTALPCNTLWWRVKDGDEKVCDFVSSLVNASMGEDAAYLYSLLGMASSLPPHEQEHLLKQFRDARLEEDGFVSSEESVELFGAFDGGALFSKWNRANSLGDQAAMIASKDPGLFLERVIKLGASSGRADFVATENVQRGFAYLANALSSACHVEPDDINGLSSLLQQLRYMVSFGLEVLSSGDVNLAVEILFTEYPKSIFRFSLSVLDAIRLEALSGLRSLDLSKAQKLESLWRTGKFGAVLWSLDRDFADSLGFEATETLKGLFNRFPMIKDEIVTSENILRARFRPIASVEDYSGLLAEVRAIFSVASKEILQ